MRSWRNPATAGTMVSVDSIFTNRKVRLRFVASGRIEVIIPIIGFLAIAPFAAIAGASWKKKTSFLHSIHH
jgi:hypothetical protein